jgi:hypothetical protein
VFQDSPYQDAPSPPMTPELHDACRQAVHVIAVDGRILRAGRASLFVLDRIGFVWLARPFTIPPFVWIAEFAYLVVSRNRPFFSRFLFRND